MLPRQRGFTMIEVLVVVLLLFLLAVLVLPALTGTRVPARQASCASNCGIMIKCCHLYSDSTPNLGLFPMFDVNHNGNGQQALAKLYDAYVKDHRVFSCVNTKINTSGLTSYVAPEESTLQTGYTNYGYDPGHTQEHATAGVLGDMGVLHPTNHKNSTNHGADGPGQNVALGSGCVEWWDAADARPTKDALDRATTDDIYADDIKEPDFPEELETNIIR